MLFEVLRAVEEGDGAVDLGALGRRLGLDRGVLEAMIAYWVRKGRLVDSAAGSACAADRCRGCAAAGAAGGCPFLLRPPRTLSGTTTLPGSGPRSSSAVT